MQIRHSYLIRMAVVSSYSRCCDLKGQRTLKLGNPVSTAKALPPRNIFYYDLHLKEHLVTGPECIMMIQQMSSFKFICSHFFNLYIKIAVSSASTFILLMQLNDCFHLPTECIRLIVLLERYPLIYPDHLGTGPGCNPTNRNCVQSRGPLQRRT